MPLPDAERWRRVRFRLVPTLTGFRYGDEHHGVAALFVRDAPADLQPDPSAACLADFERWGHDHARLFEVEIEPHQEHTFLWRGKPVHARSREGSMRWWFRRRHYAGVYASFPAWPGRCATLAYAFPMDEGPDEAKKTQARFLEEAFRRFFAGRQEPERLRGARRVDQREGLGSEGDGSAGALRLRAIPRIAKDADSNPKAGSQPRPMSAPAATVPII